jgi:hypothetical protein
MFTIGKCQRPIRKLAAVYRIRARRLRPFLKKKNLKKFLEKKILEKFLEKNNFLEKFERNSREKKSKFKLVSFILLVF